MNDERLFDTLSTQGITKVVVSFSGGNDEGGADSAIAYYADGTEKDLSLVQVYVDHRTQTHLVGEYVDGKLTTRPATPAEIAQAALMEALEQPIYERWGGFAGDFHVNGTLTWDVAARTAVLDGAESMAQSEGFSYEL